MSNNTPLCLSRGHLTINTRPGSACDFHRVTQPFMLADIAPQRPVMVFNRLPTFSAASIPLLKKAGVAVVVDMDDHFVLGEDHPLHEAYKRTGIGIQIEYCVRQADLVIASTGHLADQLRPYNPRVEVVHNALPFDTGMWTRSPDTTRKTPFVYAGGATHRKDLELIRGAYKARELTIVGFEAAHPEWQKIRQDHPQAKYEALIALSDWRNLVNIGTEWTVAGQPGRKPRIGLHDLRKRHYAEYMRAYDGHACALAPLVHNPFNLCKSNLKVLEAGAKGIPIIASSVPPYLNDLDRGYTELLEVGQWSKLGSYSRTWFEERGAALAEHVRKHYHLDDANIARRHLIEAL